MKPLSGIRTTKRFDSFLALNTPHSLQGRVITVDFPVGAFQVTVTEWDAERRMLRLRTSTGLRDKISLAELESGLRGGIVRIT